MTMIGRIPDRWEMIVRLFVALILFDTVFYWTHYVEHLYFFQWHKVHHEYNNVNLPLSLTGTYGHWIDGLAGSILPMVIPTTLCGFDLTTFWLFMVLNVLHSVHPPMGGGRGGGRVVVAIDLTVRHLEVERLVGWGLSLPVGVFFFFLSFFLSSQ